MAKKKNFMNVSSLGELTYIVNHNFDVLERRFKKLAKSNRNVKALCVVAIGYSVYTAIRSRKHEEQIYQLSVRIKKLERNEEE